MAFRIFFMLFFICSPLTASPDKFDLTPTRKNTLIKKYDNEKNIFQSTLISKRREDYPTQIVRVEGNLKEEGLACETVHKNISDLFVSKINSDLFSYNIFVSCTYDPSTKHAKHFRIHSYFDPLYNVSIDYLNDYLNINNNTKLYDTTFKVEPAEGVIIALHITSGIKDDDGNDNLYRFAEAQSNYFYKDHYTVLKELAFDIRERFFSHERNKLIPFIQNWFPRRPYIASETLLSQANYLELKPDRIFLMKDGEKIFVSALRYYYASDCRNYPNSHCL